MMRHSAAFLGWLGETAKDVTYASVLDVTVQLAGYFKQRVLPGQRLVIGYDGRFLSRELAEFSASVFSDCGVKVFFSQSAAPSPVLVTSAVHKKSVGTVVFTADDHPVSFLGVRAFCQDGFPLSGAELSLAASAVSPPLSKFSAASFSKCLKKGAVELFDPSISYEYAIHPHLETACFSPPSHRLLFNPAHNSAARYFQDLLMRRFPRYALGYTLNGRLLPDFGGLDPAALLHTEETLYYMKAAKADLGLIVSPDASSFAFLAGNQVLSAGDVFRCLCAHLSRKAHGPVSVLLDARQSDLAAGASRAFAQIDFTDTQGFFQKLKHSSYAMSVDAFGRFYFSGQGTPDALRCGFYLFESFNQPSDQVSLSEKLAALKSINT